jgi:hypothetical protein
VLALIEGFMPEAEWLDAPRVLGRIRRQWFAKRKSIMAILKEVMTNEASVLMDSDAANKALDADQALQELGSDLVGQAYVTATITVWDADPRVAEECPLEFGLGKNDHPRGPQAFRDFTIGGRAL